MKIKSSPGIYALIIAVLIVAFFAYKTYSTKFLSEKEKNIILAAVEIDCYLNTNKEGKDLKSLYTKTQDIAKTYGFSSVEKEGGLNWELAQIHPQNISKFRYIINKINKNTTKNCGKETSYLSLIQ